MPGQSWLNPGFILVVVFSVSIGDPLYAANIEQLSVNYSGAIELRLQAIIDAPVRRVAGILSKPADWAQLLPGVAQVKLLPGAYAGNQRLSIELRGCLLFFCPTLRDVMNVHHAHGEIVGNTISAMSNFSSGTIRWHFSKLSKGQTLLVVYAHLVPKIWVPPLIGPYLIEHKVKDQMRATVKRLERAAQNGFMTPVHRHEPVPIPSFIF